MRGIGQAKIELLTDEAANLLVFLVGPATRFISCTNINVNGGSTTRVRIEIHGVKANIYILPASSAGVVLSVELYMLVIGASSRIASCNLSKPLNGVLSAEL